MAKEPQRHMSSETTMTQPDPELHQMISFAKSAVRIISSVGCVVFAAATTLPLAIAILAIGYALAEVIGIIEELV